MKKIFLIIIILYCFTNISNANIRGSVFNQDTFDNVDYNVRLFYSDLIGNTVDGNSFYVYRYAAEGTDFIRLYIDKNRNQYIRGANANNLYIDNGSYATYFGKDGVSYIRGFTVDITSRLRVQSAIELDRSAQSTNFTATSSDTIYGITNTSAERIVTLNTSLTEIGRIYIIKDESGGAGTNTINIVTQGSETIDGAASIYINENYGVKRLYSDGTNWFTF